MLTAGHFRAVQSEQQFKAGGTCTSTSYGGLQLGTCMYLLVFSVIGSLPSHAIIAEQVHKLSLLIWSFLHGLSKDVWSLMG
jgi:hypothetical protein